MDVTVFPTKGNLINALNTMELSKQGYGLLDKKRNILIREMMLLIDNVKSMQSKIDTTFSAAYKALQSANISMGISTIEQVGLAAELKKDISIKRRSVMGVDIPVVSMAESPHKMSYGMFETDAQLDIACQKFEDVRVLIIQLAELETSVYRLAINIKKTQKRANALKNIVIPKYEALTKSIMEVLEEKDREEFSRLKYIKNMQEGKNENK